MGLDSTGTQFMLWLAKRGVDFSATATIGRQSLAATREELKRNFDYFGRPVEDSAFDGFYDAAAPFAEKFLSFLGARKIDSFDFSAFEGATVVHDMNLPIPEQFKSRYSLVIDGGCLEHIFNFPTAMKNCMEMLKVGGHLAVVTPCNNFVGHGFYQFSPELFFRMFAPANGYKFEAAFIVENRPDATWWLVRDPEEVRSRVTVVTEAPALLYVLARRIQEITPFEKYPQQSDYVALWKGQEPPKETLSMRQRLARRLLGARRHQIVAMMPPFVRGRLVSRYDPRFFKAADLRREI